MKDSSKKYFSTSRLFEDYATRPVPEKKRFSWLSQGLIWSGSGFCLAAFSLGSMLASAMGFSWFMAAVLLGSGIITVIGCLLGVIGARTHLSSAFNARFTLGAGGGKIFGLILAVSLFGWFGYQCYYFARGIIGTLRLFGFSSGSPTVWAIAGGLLMMITAIAGSGGIRLLSNLGVPLLFFMVLIAAGITVGHVEFSALKAASAQSAGGMGLSSGIVIVVGSFVSGSCIMPDFSRFSKKPREAVYSCGLGFMIAFPLVLLLGGFFYYAYSVSDICEVFVACCGLGVFAPFLLVVSTWTTNDGNLYSAVLGLSNALDDYVKLPQWILTVIVGVISTVLGALGIMESFTSFMNLLGVLIPPIAAVIIADYYLYNRNSGLYAYENANKLPNFRGNTCVSAIAGILTGLLCNYAPIGFLRALCSVLPACIVAMLVSVGVLVIYNTVARSGTVRVDRKTSREEP